MLTDMDADGNDDDGDGDDDVGGAVRCCAGKLVFFRSSTRLCIQELFCYIALTKSCGQIAFAKFGKVRRVISRQN